MKIGVAGGYPRPAGVGPERALEWLIGEAPRLGIEVVGGSARPVSVEQPLQYDLDALRRLRDLADSNSVTIEPTIRTPFVLATPDAEDAAADLRANLRASKILGGPVMRTGYGKLTIETSRFNRQVPLAEQLGRLTAHLRQAAAIAADEGVVIAVENHCDFSGRELASVLAAVGSPAVQADLDTGNSLTVFSDPADDLAALAPYTVTTHLKDMAVIQQTQRGLVPFQAVGCALGEGFVDIAETVRVLLTTGPLGDNLPLNIETGWIPVPPGGDSATANREAYAKSIAYLRKLLGRDGH
jgi:sugar phosphate isomerase/epimerase